MKIEKLVLLSALLCSFSSAAFGQGVIANRSALNVLLGSNRADEGFETYNQNGGASTGAGTMSALDWDGYTNMIIGGITLSSTWPNPGERWIQWNGAGFKGIPSQNIFSSGDLLLDFWNPTVAFGIDLKDFTLYTNTFIASVTVYGADDTTILYQDNGINMTDPANGVFFGYQFGGGIGSVLFTTVSGADPDNTIPHVFSPKIDDLAFSTVPEPTTLSLVVVGVAALWFVRKGVRHEWHLDKT